MTLDDLKEGALYCIDISVCAEEYATCPLYIEGGQCWLKILDPKSSAFETADRVIDELYE